MQCGTLGDENLSLQMVPAGVTMALSWRPLSKHRLRKTPPGRKHHLANTQQKFLQNEHGHESLSWGRFYGHKQGRKLVPQIEMRKHAPYSTASPMGSVPAPAHPRSWKLALHLGHLCKRPLLPRLIPKYQPQLGDADPPTLPLDARGTLVTPAFWFSSWSSVISESPSCRALEGPEKTLSPSLTLSWVLEQRGDTGGKTVEILLKSVI